MEVDEQDFNYDYTLLNIKLNGSEPSIYRRVVVPEDISLDRLSDVILLLFNWEGYELCSFKIKNKYYRSYDNEDFDNENLKDANEDNSFNISLFRLNMLTKERSRFIMYYDYWELGIFVEKTRFYNETPKEICCIGGANSSPPAMIEKLEHFYELSDAYNKHNSPLYETARKLLGDNFNISFFNKASYNFFLDKYCDWARDRDLSWYDNKEESEIIGELFDEIIKKEAEKLVDQKLKELNK